MTALPIPLSEIEIDAFCQKWLISELSLFGSILREDFRTDSDIDFLVAYKPESKWSLLDCVEMQMELSEIVGRQTDLVSKKSIQRSHNYIRRNNILSTAKVIYSDTAHEKE